MVRRYSSADHLIAACTIGRVCDPKSIRCQGSTIFRECDPTSLRLVVDMTMQRIASADSRAPASTINRLD
ncbi:hypothetical protein RBSWK_03150 [Rhodopirellula baltica SWK14]|uniref:Uncharacterized protein n=1 Tax=Rhodopirellula baltica SWK14 TaxID=993516 RepID=L7CFV5_RHOBT|nr:hypothetical protein RBSWK_03150 [Rhodopirellula baltica SWK14]